MLSILLLNLTKEVLLVGRLYAFDASVTTNEFEFRIITKMSIKALTIIKNQTSCYRLLELRRTLPTQWSHRPLSLGGLSKVLTFSS